MEDDLNITKIELSNVGGVWLDDLVTKGSINDEKCGDRHSFKFLGDVFYDVKKKRYAFAELYEECGMIYSVKSDDGNERYYLPHDYKDDKINKIDKILKKISNEAKFGDISTLETKKDTKIRKGMRLVAENLIFLDTFEGFICIFSSDQYVII